MNRTTLTTKQHRNDFREIDQARFTRVDQAKAKIAAGTYDSQAVLNATVERVMSDVFDRTTRRTPAQLTDQASLDGQSAELNGGMCESDS